jgi:NitT/TauT family transport system substrate-binding protein
VTAVRVAVPDLVSNSYFPAIAAIALGFFAKEGLAASHELIFPNYKAYEALRDGRVDFVAGPAHVTFRAFPQGRGAKFLAALSQGMYWLLVMRADLAATPGDVNAVKGRTIGAAPLVNEGLKRLLIDAGLDLDRDQVRIVGVPGTEAPGVSSGVAAANALEGGNWMASGRMPWAPRMPCAAASARSCSTCAAGSAPPPRSTTPCRCWPRARA